MRLHHLQMDGSYFHVQIYQRAELIYFYFNLCRKNPTPSNIAYSLSTFVPSFHLTASNH